jgi:hypothetical protein
LTEFKIPEYSSPRRAARVLRHLERYASYLKALQG